MGAVVTELARATLPDLVISAVSGTRDAARPKYRNRIHKLFMSDSELFTFKSVFFRNLKENDL